MQAYLPFHNPNAAVAAEHRQGLAKRQEDDGL
jgi:hypothetical protein